jgi:hypothetical protein
MIKCKHQTHQTEVLNNGLVWCKGCGATDLYNFRVRNDNNEIVFNGTIWECENFIKEQNEKEYE